MPNMMAPIGNPATAVLISRQTPSGTGVVTFSSIPQIYSHLQMRVLGRGTEAGQTDSDVRLTLNNDTTQGVYTSEFLAGVSTLTLAGEVLAADNAQNMVVGSVTAADAPSGSAAAFILEFPEYTSTTFHKSIYCSTGRRVTEVSAGIIIAEFYGMYIATAAAITRIDLTLEAGNWVAGSSVSLYGVP